MAIALYTDGGWKDGRGGWAWIAVDLARNEALAEEHDILRAGSRPIPPGSYWAEAYAIALALESRYAAGAVVRTDLQRIIQTLNEQVRGHLTRALAPIERRVADGLETHGARLEYLPRNADRWAERADQLANRRRMRRYGYRRRYRR